MARGTCFAGGTFAAPRTMDDKTINLWRQIEGTRRSAKARARDEKAKRPGHPRA